MSRIIIPSLNSSFRSTAYNTLLRVLPEYSDDIVWRMNHPARFGIELALSDGNGIIVGESLNSNTSYLQFVGVDYSLRRRGIGRSLVCAFESKVKENFGSVIITTDAHNGRTSWFKNLGYAIDCFNPDGSTHMRKEL